MPISFILGKLKPNWQLPYNCHTLIVLIAGPYIVTTSTGPDYITINWRSAFTYSLLIQMLQVIVTPECPTGVVEAQTRVYNVTNMEMTSMNLNNLGNSNEYNIFWHLCQIVIYHYYNFAKMQTHFIV